MKTITKGSVSVYLFEDSEPISITDTEITVGNPPRFIVGDCNSLNSTLYENVTGPDDWIGGKYLFDGTTWTLNPSWVDPQPNPIPE